MKFYALAFEMATTHYLLVQYEVKNEFRAKSFNLEAGLGQMDSL